MAAESPEGSPNFAELAGSSRKICMAALALPALIPTLGMCVKLASHLVEIHKLLRVLDLYLKEF